MTNQSKLEQGRAEKAYKFAEAGAKSPKPSEYKSYTKKIPMLIKTNGLGSCFAFMKSKGGTYDLLYKQTYQYLKEYDKMKIFDTTEKEDLAKIVISQNSAQYRYLTLETLALFGWLKRFADGLIDDKDEQNSSSES
jgi:CRISPR-associated protein Cmr5